MIKIVFNMPISFAGLKETIADVIQSTAAEEAVLSNMIGIEQDIAQNAKHFANNIDEFFAINESVNNIIRNVTKLQMLIQIKLQSAEDLLQKVRKNVENEEPARMFQELKGFDDGDALEE